MHWGLRRSQISTLLFAMGALVLSACDKAPATESANSGGGPAKKSTDDERDAAPVLEPKKGDEADLVPSTSSEPELKLPAFAEGAAPEVVAIFSELSEWVRSKKGKLNVAVLDLKSDEWLVRENAEVPINVASNAKLVTAAGALELLGPSFQFRTELFGDIDEAGRAKRLVLRGGGDPEFSTADLYRLVQVARGRGLAEVEEIAVDQSLFDDKFVPPSYEQQPQEWAPFRANISALALNRNAVSLNVFSTRSGEPARVWYDPPGVVEPSGRVETGKKASGDKVHWNLEVEENPQFPASKVGGSLAEGLGRRRYARRLEDPRRAGGLALSSILKELGVKHTGEVALGERKKEPRLALWNSSPLAELVRDLGKDSDNFVAEMLLVSLSSTHKPDSEKSEPVAWSSSLGASLLEDWLKSKSLLSEGIVVKNGSGLFDGNRYSASLLTKLLAQMAKNPRVRQEYTSQLATGGVDGTLRKRMKGHEMAGRVRAKTGTLRNVISLSGYLQRTGGEPPAAFSVIVSDLPGRHGAVRKRIDQAVLKVLSTLD